MKFKNVILAIALLGQLSAAPEHHIKAPNGGRIIDAIEPHAEFLLTPERKIEIRFLDDHGIVIPPGEQIVIATTGERANPTRLTFVKEGDKLVSDKTVPAGEELPMVIQIRPKAGAKAKVEKFTLNLHVCAECDHPEYACACDHDGHDGDHDHKH